MPAIDWTRPIETVDGRKCCVLCTDLNRESDKVALSVTECNGYEWITTCDSVGRNAGGQFVRNVPEKFSREVWVNVYENFVVGFTSKYSAVSHAERGLLACIRVPVTGHVGQFDE